MKKQCPECKELFSGQECECGFKIKGTQGPSKRMAHRSECAYCRSTGLIRAEKDKCSYVFKCGRCENSVACLPVWHDELCVQGYSWEDNGPRFDPIEPEQIKGLVFIKEVLPKVHDEFVRQHPNYKTLIKNN